MKALYIFIHRLKRNFSIRFIIIFISIYIIALSFNSETRINRIID